MPGYPEYESPKLDPSRPVPGEFSQREVIEVIRAKLKTGEGVIIDPHGIPAADLAALKKAIQDAGFVLDRDVIMYE